MRTIIINGVRFTTFVRNGERYLCTGDVDGTVKFAFAGEVADYCTVVGATSVVSGNLTVHELYEKWLDRTEFYRSIGLKF